MTSLINSGAKVLVFFISARVPEPFFDEMQNLQDKAS